MLGPYYERIETVAGSGPCRSNQTGISLDELAVERLTCEMRADDRDLDLFGFNGLRIKQGVAASENAVAPSFRGFNRSMQLVTESGKPIVLEGVANERDAERQAIARIPAGTARADKSIRLTKLV